MRLVAGALRWAAESPQAIGQTYDLTDAKVLSFRDLWSALANTLGVQVGPDAPLSMAEYIPAHAAVWQHIVERHDLARIPMTTLLGESHHYADMCFAYGASASPPPMCVSTVKIRQAGFTAAWNTEESSCHWLRDLIARRILPPA